MATSDSTPKQLPLPIEGETVEISLTRGWSTIIDAVDVDLLMYKWSASGNKYIYAARSVTHGEGKLHRLILQRINGRPLTRAEYGDHINGNTLDNRRSNLRIATNTQNQWNASKRSDSNGFKGITAHGNKWRAIIQVNGKRIRLGNYATPEEAHEAYKRAAIQYYGEFARFE